MAGNLKARLGRIRSGETPKKAEPERPAQTPAMKPEDAAKWPGWTVAGHMTLKREFCRPLCTAIPADLSDALAILVPDFAGRENRQRISDLGSIDRLLFFDLETTGLSGGAGTVAFLAAFGRYEPPGEIRITQYLLLDYPGEPDFLECVVAEFAATATPFMVSYNGKSFDSQILKTRLLMNGIRPPEYRHADLLHPARRLWKRKLPDCSQATIEVEVLGLDRSGDVSGAMALDIWFSFLRDGETGDLLSICEHNAKDIAGLASILLAMMEIAEEPVNSQEKYRYDDEGLALYWRDVLRKRFLHLSGNVAYEKLAETGELLLTLAAENGCPRAAVALAINAEWRTKDINAALRYTNIALDNCEGMGNLRDELNKRRARLEGKL